MSLQRIVEYFIKRPLSGKEIQRLTGSYPIYYSDLGKYKTLEELLKATGKPYAIILYQTSSKSDGHFNCIGTSPDGNCWHFDPYGYTDEQVRQYTPYDNSLKLPDYISALCNDYAQRHNVKFLENTTDFQARSGNVADCGRHCAVWCLLSQTGMTFDNLRELYFTNADGFLKGDHVATILTLMALGDIGKWYEENK